MEGKRFVGIDLGKRTYVACAISRGGSLEQWHGKTDGVGRDHLAVRLRYGDVVGVEAGSTAFHIARRLQTVGGVRVVVLNPGKLAVIYASMKKTDKEDGVPRRPPFLWVRDPPWQLPVQPCSEECMERGNPGP
jgi:transposase